MEGRRGEFDDSHRNFFFPAISKQTTIAFAMEMESRGNYYSAERRNRDRSKGEVKTESVSARARAQRNFAPACSAFLQTRHATERGVSDTNVHLVPC